MRRKIQHTKCIGEKTLSSALRKSSFKCLYYKKKKKKKKKNKKNKKKKKKKKKKKNTTV